MREALLRSSPFRLTVLLGAAFLISLAVAGFIAYQLIRDELNQRIDRSVLDDFTVISQAYGDNDVVDLVDAVDSHVRATIDHDRVFLLRGLDGAVLAGNISSATISAGWSTVPAEALGLPEGGDAYRVYGNAIGGNQLLVGASFAETNAVGRLALTSIGWASAVLLALIVSVGVFVATKAQRRLDAIAETMHQVGRGELGARIAVGLQGDDIDSLSREVNAALDRLAALVESMRQVSVDIAHDLKTPLNRLAITVESAIEAEAAGQAVGDLLAQAQHESDQINTTFDALLRIAQIESGARRARFAQLPIKPILDTLAEAYSEVAEEWGQSLSLVAPAALPPIAGDKDLLTQLFANLIENTIRHCPAGTAMTITAMAEPEYLTVTIADNGPGIPPEERDKVFQRLYRLEKSRTTPGSGLGLSLVKAIADLHGASIVLTDNAPGLSVAMRFPIAR